MHPNCGFDECLWMISQHWTCPRAMTLRARRCLRLPGSPPVPSAEPFAAGITQKRLRCSVKSSLGQPGWLNASASNASLGSDRYHALPLLPHCVQALHIGVLRKGRLSGRHSCLSGTIFRTARNTKGCKRGFPAFVNVSRRCCVQSPHRNLLPPVRQRKLWQMILGSLIAE